jgi:RimJ/RimL family protein N-acetyltransferase
MPARSRASRLEAEKITAERLDLIPLTPDHAAEMADVLADPGLYTFIGGEPPTVEALRARYERMLAGPENHEESWCNWVLSLRGEEKLVGTVQATVTPEATEIAWVVGIPWQHRGFASEAARALVDWLRIERHVQTVIAHIHPDHQGSARVAASAGLFPTERSQDGEIEWRRDDAAR